jgi:hypothetical protein
MLSDLFNLKAHILSSFLLFTMGNNSSKRGKTFKYTFDGHVPLPMTDRIPMGAYYTSGSKLVHSTFWKSEDHQRVVRDIIQDEYDLRRLVQIEETLNHRAIARRKEAGFESITAQTVGQIEAELTAARSEYTRAKTKLYTDEVTLPPHLKHLYDSLRRNPEWYMREGLVENCSAQDGCCSRGCGCCEKRSLSEKKGQGHCTINCWCCSVHRGYDPTAAEQIHLKSQLDRLFERFEYLERMGNWLFDPLRSGELGDSEHTRPK